jgi:hypothetical protein
MGVGHIAIQNDGEFAFLQRPLRRTHEVQQHGMNEVCVGIAGREHQRFVDRRLGGAELLDAIGRGKGANLEDMRLGEADGRAHMVSVKPERRLEQGARFVGILHREWPVHDRPAAHGKVHRIHVVRPLALRPLAFRRDQLDADPARQPRGDLVLHVEQIGAWLVEAFGPEMCAGVCIDDLRQ